MGFSRVDADRRPSNEATRTATERRKLAAREGGVNKRPLALDAGRSADHNRAMSRPETRATRRRVLRPAELARSRRGAAGRLLVLLVIAVAGGAAGCRSDRKDETSLVEREQIAFGYSNEIRRIEALRAEYEEQKETLEILFSEMDRQSELIAKYERDIAQASGRVAALQGQLQAELDKEKALREQAEAAKKAAAEAAAGAAPAPPPPAAGTPPPAGGEPPK